MENSHLPLVDQFLRDSANHKGGDMGVVWENWVLGLDGLGLNLGAAVHGPGDLSEPTFFHLQKWLIMHLSCRVVVNLKCSNACEVPGALAE